MLTLAWTNAFAAIWPIFGGANQLLAALSLIATSAWLVRQDGKRWPVYTLLPAAAMLVTPVLSLVMLLPRYARGGQWSLVAAEVALIALALGVVVVALAARKRGTRPSSP